MRTAEMDIRWLDSDAAGRGVRSALRCIHGVAQVRTMPQEHRVAVTYDAFKVRMRQFQTAVRVMGCEIGHIRVWSEYGTAMDYTTVANVDMASPPEIRFERTHMQ